MKQHKIDSFLESFTSTIVGFLVAMLTWQFIVNPLYGYDSDLVESLGVTTIFTVASIARQYVIRRMFNGKSVYVGIREYMRRRK